LLLKFSFQTFLIARRFFTPPGLQDLLLDLCYATCTNSAATFADCEAKTFFHSDWLDELNSHLSVIARHNHFCT
jgi:hypothetical protein